MNCPCGCSSAESCWNSCCCHTDIEKLAWARKNSVRPPEFLAKRVAARTAAKNAQATDRCCDSGDQEHQACNACCANSGVTDKSTGTPLVTIQRRTMACCIGGRRVVCEVEIPIRTVVRATQCKSCVTTKKPTDDSAGCSVRGHGPNSCGATRERSRTSPHSRVVTIQAAMMCKGMPSIWTVIASGVITSITPAVPITPIVIDHLYVRDLRCTTRTLAPEPPVPINFAT